MQVFISHSDSDSPLAARVSKALRKAGLQVWDPDVHILPGDNWPAEVGRALEESDAMVVLLTPNSVSSPHVKAKMAFALRSKSYRNRLIPVAVGGRELLPSSEIPWMARPCRLRSSSPFRMPINLFTERLARVLRVPADGLPIARYPTRYRYQPAVTLPPSNARAAGAARPGGHKK